MFFLEVFCVKFVLYEKRNLIGQEEKKVGNVLFNDTLNTFFIYGYMMSDLWQRTIQKAREKTCFRGLLFPISSKDSFICTIPQTG